MKKLSLILAVVSLLASNAWSDTLNEILDQSGQIVLTVGKDENSARGRVETWEKKNNKWIQVGSAYKAKMGRKGLATGLGLTTDSLFNQTATKVEGDGKTPTGIFSIGQVYGKASAGDFNGKLTYTQATKDYIGVDDPQSKYYNQIIRKSQTSLVDWDSHEEIYHPPTYNWLLEVDHNPQNLSAQGSLIFFHATRPLLFLFYKTAGCVAIQTKNLIQVLRWIDPKKNPKFIIIDSAKEIEFKNLLKSRSLN